MEPKHARSGTLQRRALTALNERRKTKLARAKTLLAEVLGYDHQLGPVISVNGSEELYSMVLDDLKFRVDLRTGTVVLVLSSTREATVTSMEHLGEVLEREHWEL